MTLPPPEYGIRPDVMAIATAHAAADRDTLARLIVEGRVERGDPTRVPGGRAFRDDIECRVNAITGKRPLNLAIRPKAKAKRKR